MEKSVLIMMATYNGEKYIREQIESIINQSYKNWTLIIQDDGSMDETVEIIEKYCSIDDRISLLINNSENHGAFVNFHILINKCKKMQLYDYYMFCDQDDIWLENKIEKMIVFSEKRDKTPILCYADMLVIDDESKKTLDSLNSKWCIEKKNRTSLFFSHKIFGCNMIINKKLFELVPEIDLNTADIDTLSHDNYYAKFAAVFGRFYYIPEALMEYRRHEENATSEQKYDITLKRILDRIFNINVLAQKHAATYNQSLTAISNIKKVKLSEEQMNFVNSVEYILKTGGIRALIFCMKHQVRWGKFVENTSRKLILTMGLYRKYLVIDAK